MNPGLIGFLGAFFGTAGLIFLTDADTTTKKIGAMFLGVIIGILLSATLTK